MITQISNVNDVVAFAKQLIVDENLSVHPDDDFNDYIKYKTKLPFYSHKDAEIRNELMKQCFSVCEEENIEIYELFYNKMEHSLTN